MKRIEAVDCLVTVRVVASTSSRLSCLPYNYQQRALPNHIRSLQVSAVLPQADVAAAAAAKASCTILPDTGASRLVSPGTQEQVAGQRGCRMAPQPVQCPTVHFKHHAAFLQLSLDTSALHNTLADSAGADLISDVTRRMLRLPSSCSPHANPPATHTLADTAGADLTFDEILPDLVVPAGSAQACW